MPQLVFRPVIVNRETDIVLFYELLDSRQSLWRWVASDNDGNACSLAVFEFAANVRIVILLKINRSGSVGFHARRGVVRERGGLLLNICREVIFDVF